MKRTYFDRIEDYLSGSMNEAEKIAFEAELKQNEELAAEFEQQQLAWKAMHLLAVDEMRHKLKGWIAEEALAEKTQPKVVQMRRPIARILSIAASVLLLICAGTWWWANENYSARSLADAYYENEMSGTRGIEDGEEDENYKYGITEHYRGNWIASTNALLQVPFSNKAYCYAQTLAAEGYYRQKKFQEALKVLNNLRMNPACPEVEWKNAKWQIVLVYFAMGETSDETINRLNEVINTPGHPREADELKQKTQSFWWKLIN